MIKVKDGYAKLIGTTYQGSATQVLLSNGGDLEYSASSKASTLVQRNASQHIYATYFNSAISDEALTDIGSVYVRNTSDTFIRRVSKTQFYSILDDKFVTLDTTQSITGAKTFSTSVRFANNASIIQNQNDTSNYTTILKWYKNGASRNTYDPSIGQHNTGGDGNGSICILPYPTETSPWGGMVGLFISKGVLKLDGKSVALAKNYYTKTESDKRYVNVTGDTMTGPLIVKAAITGTQLISTIATGTSPLKVTSTTVVTNLNSDLLDGLHETSFFRARGDQSIASSVPTTTELATSNNLCGSWNVKYTGASGHLVQFNAGSGSTRYMQFYSMYSGSLYWRNSTGSTLNTKSWKTIVDSANYTGIVLKIGTATKGSATLPIYLNAGTPTACSTTLGVSITGNAATATKLQTARTINGTSFNGTANIVTAYWGTARTISLSGAVTGSASVNGRQNVTITTTYQFGSIDGRYVGGNKTANHGSSGTAYTADTYSSTFVNKAFVAFAERGSWVYANNGYVSTDTGVNIPLAGTAIFQWGASDTNKTQLYITPHNNSGVSNPAANEMLFYTSNGSGYTSAWTRVLTHRNYTNYTVTKTGGGASGTWGISITGTAASARKLYKINGTSRTWSTSKSVVGNGIVAYTDTTTSGRWDSYGSLFQFSNADNPTPGTNGHWLTQLWSGTSNKLGVRWRTNTRGWTTMQTILTNTNYISYADTRYVTSLGTNGTYVTWVKNGTTNNLTVPYSSYSGYLQSHDTRSTNNTPAQFSRGARFEFKYNSTDGLSNGGTYHGILHFKPYGGTTDFSGGQTHQLGFTDGGNLYMRTSTSSSAWGSWKLILTQTTADRRYVTSLGTNGNYLTWTKAGTTNNITVPYATNSNKANYIYYGSISNLNSPSSWTSDGYRLVYDTYSGSASNKPVSQDNANGIITLFKSKRGTSNQYVSQLAFPNNTRMYFRYASAGSFSSWYTIAYTSDIKNPANYYWANVKVSASSNSGTSPTFSTAYTSNWFRSTGNSGWYHQDYGGGWYMSDSTWIRTYGSKSVYQNTGQIRTDGYLVTKGGLTAGATSPNNKTYKLHVTGASWSSGLIRAGGGFYHNSVNSNSYVLLAGGSYKGLGDFAKGNAGSATKGVYVTGGTVTAMTYSLSSNLNSGTSGKLAYYSSATTVKAYSSSVGSSAQPIYLNAGSPSASSYSFTGTYSNPVIVWCGEIYRSTPGSTYWYSEKKGGCCSISFTTNNAGSNGNLIISIPHCEPYAAFCSTVRIFDGSTAISARDGTITGRSAGMGDYMTICGVSGTTGNVYIRKFSQQNADNDTWRNGELGTTTTSKGNKPVARFYLMIVGRYI